MRVLSRARKIPWRRAWRPTPALLPGEAHGQRSLAHCSPGGHREWDTHIARALCLVPKPRTALACLLLSLLPERSRKEKGLPLLPLFCLGPFSGSSLPQVPTSLALSLEAALSPFPGPG